jgi:hypothetical protein
MISNVGRALEYESFAKLMASLQGRFNKAADHK